jgi:hypothetical protein
LEWAEWQAHFEGRRQPQSLDPRWDFTPMKIQALPRFERIWLRMPQGDVVEIPMMDFHGISFRQRNKRLYELLTLREVPGGVMIYLHTFDAKMRQVATMEMARYWEKDLAWIEKKGYFTDAGDYSYTYVFYENRTLTDSIVGNIVLKDNGEIEVVGEKGFR